MRIVLDAMGGDLAPSEVVRGGLDAAQELGLEVILVGTREIIQSELARLDHGASNLHIVEASQVVEMEEQPAAAIRYKRDSSIGVGLKLLKEGQASAFVSAGNSGAVVTAAILILERIKGIERPAIALVFPTPTGIGLFLDAGANSDCKPAFLVQFAQLGSEYMERVFGIPNPGVGLLSNGEEENKGSRLVRGAYKLLRDSNLNFIGNIEGKDIYRGLADVIVTDGFTGNVLVKATEGLSEAILLSLKGALTSSLSARLTAFLWSPALSLVAKNWDYTEYGGAPLLGLNGTVIMAHGRSDAKAIKNAIALAKRSAEESIPALVQKDG